MYEVNDFYHSGQAPPSKAEIHLLALMLISANVPQAEKDAWRDSVSKEKDNFERLGSAWTPGKVTAVPTADFAKLRKLMCAVVQGTSLSTLEHCGALLSKKMPEVEISCVALKRWLLGLRHQGNRAKLHGPFSHDKHRNALQRHVYAMVPVALHLLNFGYGMRRALEGEATELPRAGASAPTKAELAAQLEATAAKLAAEKINISCD